MDIAFVKTHGTNSGAATATTITLVPVSTIPIGNFVIMGVGSNTIGTTITVADTQSNTYQVDRSETSTARATHVVSAKITTAVGTGDTITVTFSASRTNRLLSVDEFSGLHATSWLGQANSAVGTSTTPDSGNVTTTDGAGLLYGACQYGNAGAAYAPGTTNAGAYTYIESNEVKIASNTGIETEYYRPSAVGTYSANGTITSAVWTQIIVSYKAAAGGLMMFF